MILVWWMSLGYLLILSVFFFLMIRRPPRSTLDRSSAASDVYKRQEYDAAKEEQGLFELRISKLETTLSRARIIESKDLSLIHISEPTRPY